MSKIQKTFLSMLLTVSAFAFVACDNGSTPPPTEPETPAIEYTLNEAELDMYIGESFQLTVDELEEGQEVIWGSLNMNVATVEGGLVQAVAQGETVVQAIVGTTTLECTVRVSIDYEAVPFVELENELPNADGTYAITLLVGDEYSFDPVLICGNSNPSVVFTATSENSALEIDGLTVTAVSTCENAELQISCEYEDQTYAVTVYVTVK